MHFLHRQLIQEGRYLIAENSKVENEIYNNGADHVLIKQLSILNSQLLTYQNMKAKKTSNKSNNMLQTVIMVTRTQSRDSSVHVDKKLTLNQ